MRRILVALALIALAALAIAACGGGSGDETAITETIETAATTADPGNCTELQTLRFNEQNSATEGKGATRACEEEARRNHAEVAEAVTVSNISVEGEDATAEVELEGGALNSQTIEMALVEEGGDWKLDQIEGFASYDGEALAEAFEKVYEEEARGLSKEQISCIGGRIGELNQEGAEVMFLSGSPAGAIALAKSCGRQDRQVIH
ncbi:MAG TPA: hypothetical protein VHE08_06555 [Solirubrobacterales bacterium]|nr:hypothetical protein [Solirubrobacterales bacterium]